MNTAIIGASGYGGGELIRFVDAHPVFEASVLCAHSKAGQTLGSVHPHLSGGDRRLISFGDADFSSVEIAFLALPHGASSGPAMDLLSQGIKVVDLGSDFRLDSRERYLDAYGTDHPVADQLGKWAYGIPELFGDAISSSDRVAAPGCYPTSVALAVAPLVAADLVDPTTIIVDSMSGVTGAGRTANESLMFGAVDESVKAYKVLTHRHQPEMEQTIGQVGDVEPTVIFTPHLVPMQRGILSTIYLDLRDGVTAADVAGAFATMYKGSTFVRTADVPPETSWVVGSNNAIVSYQIDDRTGKLLAFCAIDNLVKGAAGQAVQCANLMVGLDEAAGLPMQGWMP